MRFLINFLFYFPFVLLAQVPQDIPVDSKPVDFNNPWNYIVYIVIPILLLIFYIWWRKNRPGKNEG